MSSLTPNKIAEMQKMSDVDLRTQIIADLSELRARQKQMIKADKNQSASEGHDNDLDSPKPSKLKQRIAAAKKKQNATGYKSAFAM